MPLVRRSARTIGAPYLTVLNLVLYGSLLDREERVQQVVQAVEKNRVVEDLTLSDNRCVHSTLQLSQRVQVFNGWRCGGKD
jgi:hypothetical protein